MAQAQIIEITKYNSNKEYDDVRQSNTDARGEFELHQSPVKISEDKLKNICLGAPVTIGILLLSVAYNCTWAVLFLLKTSETLTTDDCNTLNKWDFALSIVLFATSGLHLISVISQLLLVKSCRYWISCCRACATCVANLIVLIGVNITYFGLSKRDVCSDLADLSLYYIIVEWIILGVFVCFIIALVVLAIINKKSQNKILEQEEPKL